MSYYSEDELGYIRDKYGNYKDENEVKKAVENKILKPFNNGKFVYDPNTGQQYWADGTKRK